MPISEEEICSVDGVLRIEACGMDCACGEEDVCRVCGVEVCGIDAGLDEGDMVR